jgi:hypothetical protein
VSTENKTSELIEYSEPYFNEAVLYDYVDKTVKELFSINYQDYKKQLNYSKRNFYGIAYENFISEMDRSKTLLYLKKYQRKIVVTPTSTIYDINVINKNEFEVIRSFNYKTFGNEGIKQDERIYRIMIFKTKPTQQFPQGLSVTQVKYQSIDSYQKD